MAWVRCCGGSAKKQNVIYKDGVWNVAIDNPGSYTQQNWNTIGGTLQTDRFKFGPCGSQQIAALGTSNKFDFTNYSLLNVRCKGLTKYDSSHNTYGTVKLVSTKTNYSSAQVIPISKISSTVEHTISIDVSSVSEAYLLFQGDVGESAEVYEIWCQ